MVNNIPRWLQYYVAVLPYYVVIRHLVIFIVFYDRTLRETKIRTITPKEFLRTVSRAIS